MPQPPKPVIITTDSFRIVLLSESYGKLGQQRAIPGTPPGSAESGGLYHQNMRKKA
jgi:hypothetical protein